MEITTQNPIVTIRFEINDGIHPPFASALNIPVAEYSSYTAEQLEAMKQQQFENYIAVLDAPPIESAPAEE